MLSEAHRAVVLATVPLLEAGGEALTTHFYRLMLAEHPEVRPLFNAAHQASGAQPRALAHGVLMYAKNINRLEALGPLAAQIVNKHVALQVLPEHYPIVGGCLLRAIREVLGADVATDEVIGAWAAAYGQLADLLIGAEAKQYQALAALPGGWRGARRFTVAKKVRESDEISSFHLVPTDGGEVVAHQPGQYIGLRLVINGQEVRRNYSLSAAANGFSYRISVKREPCGVVSNFLHEQIQTGSTLELFPPAGHFTLAAGGRPLMLISGGVGITPAMAMVEAALAGEQPERPVHFVHCARHEGVHAFRETVDALAERHPQLKRFYLYDEAAPGEHGDGRVLGRITTERLASWLPAEPANVDAYFLGPQPFMRQVKRSLIALGVPEAQLRYEFFGPAASLD